MKDVQSFIWCWGLMSMTTSMPPIKTSASLRTVSE